jgi:prostaglandin-endoperoxide synthase 2
MNSEPETTARRDTSRDGLRNKIESLVLTHGRPFWGFVNRVPWLSKIVNRVIVNQAVGKAPFRPLLLSTMYDYASWSSLTDRRWFSRYLPPKEIPNLPPVEAFAHLYVTKASGPRLSDRSTLLFPTFAQWFTDGFMMTSASDTRQTTTNHQIDLGQLYGLNDTVLHALRLLAPEPGRRGRLLSEIRNGEEWAPRLFDQHGVRDPRFDALPAPIKLPDTLPAERKATMFAFGGERANSTLFTAAINTLFLREHNRLCGIIETANPGWDDERVFQTARNVNVVQLIKIVVEEYINHISPYWFKLLSDPTPCAGIARTGFRSNSTCSIAGTAWCRRPRSGTARRCRWEQLASAMGPCCRTGSELRSTAPANRRSGASDCSIRPNSCGRSSLPA